MIELIRFMKESRRDEPPFMAEILCLNCATVLPHSNEDVRCTKCGVEIKIERYIEIYKYSCDALRYGHQYNRYYSGQNDRGASGEIKPCLPDLPEIYKFIAIAIASGIIGGASWDVTKQAIQKILAELECGAEEIQERIEPTLDLAQIESIASDIHGYTEGLSHVNKTVVPLVLEEMYADSTSQCLDELEEIHKLLEKPNKKEKNRKRAMKLNKRLMQRIISGKLNKPDKLPIDEIWSEIEENNQVNKDASR